MRHALPLLTFTQMSPTGGHFHSLRFNPGCLPLTRLIRSDSFDLMSLAKPLAANTLLFAAVRN